MLKTIVTSIIHVLGPYSKMEGYSDVGTCKEFLNLRKLAVIRLHDRLFVLLVLLPFSNEKKAKCLLLMLATELDQITPIVAVHQQF